MRLTPFWGVCVCLCGALWALAVTRRGVRVVEVQRKNSVIPPLFQLQELYTATGRYSHILFSATFDNQEEEKRPTSVIPPLFQLQELYTVIGRY